MANPTLIKQGVERRTKIVKFVREFTASEGFSPNIAEIASGVGLASQSGIPLHLQILQEEGYLTFRPNTSRSIVLSSPAPDGWVRRG